MIHDGFIYLATLMLLAAILVNLPVYLRGKGAQTFFKFAPPIVLIYLGMMLLCTMKVWDLQDTSAVYVAIKNPLLYAMLFLMLLRCDLKKIIKLGPKMLIGFFSASISIGVGFVVSYGIFHKLLGPDSWKALAALCGSWLGGGSNMLAVQAILDVSEERMAEGPVFLYTLAAAAERVVGVFGVCVAHDKKRVSEYRRRWRREN